MSIEEIQVNILNKLKEDVPVSIHKIWSIIPTSGIKAFVKAFHEMPNVYKETTRIIFYRGCPYLIFTRKDNWQFTQNDFISHEIFSEIIDNDLVNYYLECGSAIDTSFVMKIIEEAELNNLKKILNEFQFTDEDVDEFLNYALECQKNTKNNDFIDIIVFIMKHKYTKRLSDLRYQIHRDGAEIEQYKEKTENINRELKQVSFEYRIMKYVFISTISIIILSHLFIM